MRGSHESFPPHEVPAKKSRKDDSFWEKAKRSPMVKAGMLAAGIHGVVLESPVVVKAVKDAYGQLSGEAAHAFERSWNAENAVIHVQTAQEQKAIQSSVEQRESRKNASGLEAFRKTARERMERGEAVTYQELYFEQAELNGVPKGEVQEAWQVSNEMISYYAGRVHQGGQEFDESFIKKTSQEMYDRAEYVWGNGSVVGYFKKEHPTRNCVAIAQAQRIVFEGVINRLPETERWKYQLGNRMVKQHDVATLLVSQQRDASPFITHLLEPPFTTERDGAPAGTATVDQVLLKRALVSDKPIRVKATEPKKGEAPVKSGPDIDAITDQPVDDGIVVEGALRASEYVRERVKEEERPIEVSGSDAVELEVLDAKEADALFDFHPTHTTRASEWAGPDVVDIDASSKHPLSKRQIHSLVPNDPNDILGKVSFGSSEGWSEEALLEVMMNLPVKEEISFSTNPPIDAADLFSPGRPLTEPFFSALNVVASAEAKGDWDTLAFHGVGGSDDHLSESDLTKIVQSLERTSKSIRLDYQNLSPKEAKILTDGKLKGIYLSEYYIGGIRTPNDVSEELSILKKSEVPIYYMPILPGTVQTGEGYLKDDDRFFPDLALLDAKGIEYILQESQQVNTKKAKLVAVFCRNFLGSRSEILRGKAVSDWKAATALPLDQALRKYAGH